MLLRNIFKDLYYMHSQNTWVAHNHAMWAVHSISHNDKILNFIFRCNLIHQPNITSGSGTPGNQKTWQQVHATSMYFSSQKQFFVMKSSSLTLNFLETTTTQSCMSKRVIQSYSIDVFTRVNQLIYQPQTRTKDMKSSLSESTLVNELELISFLQIGRSLLLLCGI